MSKTLVNRLTRMQACQRAVSWFRINGHGNTSDDLWKGCPHGHWLIWYAVMVGVDSSYITTAITNLLQEQARENRISEDGIDAILEVTNKITESDGDRYKDANTLCFLVENCISNKLSARIVRFYIPYKVVREARLKMERGQANVIGRSRAAHR